MRRALQAGAAKDFEDELNAPTSVRAKGQSLLLAKDLTDSARRPVNGAPRIQSAESQYLSLADR